MGFITNQWLKGDAWRNRKHVPVKVSFELESTSGAWTKRNEVKGAIHATREDGNYQSVYFTEPELNALVPTLAKGADLNARREAAFDVLLCFSDEDLVRFLAELLSRRTNDRSV